MEAEAMTGELQGAAKTVNDGVSKGFANGVAFMLGDRVRKRSGSQWEGFVVGYYSTKLTHRGVCVESCIHKGSVQIYPEHALILVKSAMDLPR
jgi:hypothetical protein